MPRPLLLVAALIVALAAMFALGAAAPTGGRPVAPESGAAGEPRASGDLGERLLTTAPSRLVAFQFVSL